MWALHPRRYANIVFHKEKNLRYLPGSEPPANFHLTLEAAVQCKITRMSLLWMPGWIPIVTIFSWFEFQKEECREDFKQVNFNQTSLQTIFWLWLKCSRRLMDRSNFNWTVGSSFYFTMYKSNLTQRWLNKEIPNNKSYLAPVPKLSNNSDAKLNIVMLLAGSV